MVAQVLDAIPWLVPLDNSGAAYLWPASISPDTAAQTDVGLRPENAAAFEPFCRALEIWPNLVAARGQIAGPITCASAIMVEGKGPLLRHPGHLLALADIVGRMGARQARMMGVCKRPVMMTLDEPVLGAVVATPGATANSLWDLAWSPIGAALTRISWVGAIGGVHCCAEINWRPLIQIPELRAVSFDASRHSTGFIERFNSLDLVEFLTRGGLFAWGLVPTHRPDAPVPDLKAFRTSLKEVFEGRYREVLEKSLITPACGLGLATEKQALQVMATCGQIAAELQRDL